MDNAPPTPSKISNPKKQSVTTLLDITRANNIAIMLSRIKLTLPKICEAILEINDDALSIDDLKAISKQLPTPEEVERIKNFDEVDKLAKADQYFAAIMAIPRLHTRLDCMAYRRKLDLELEELRPDLSTLRNAAKELRASGRFRQLLQVVLVIGNNLNGGTFRGNAKGFQLDALLKLKETKTASGGPQCPTLLHYVAKVLMRKDPSLTTFIEELPSLEAAARVSVQTTVQAINSLVAGLQLVKIELQTHEGLKDVPKNDRFAPVMKGFMTQVTPAVDALKNMGSSIEADLRSLLVFYGENPDSAEAPKPEDFFSLILSFSSSLQKCALEVHDAEVSQKRTQTPIVSVTEPEGEQEPAVKAAQRAQGSAGPSSYTPKGSQGYTHGRLSVGRGDLDQAIRSMREGKRRARPQRPLSKIFFDGSSNGRRQSRAYDG